MMPDQSAFLASVGRAGSSLSKSSRLISLRPSSSFSRTSKGIAPPAGLSPGMGANRDSKFKSGGEAMRVLQTMWAHTATLHRITRQNKNLVDLSPISKRNHGKDFRQFREARPWMYPVSRSHPDRIFSIFTIYQRIRESQ